MLSSRKAFGIMEGIAIQPPVTNFLSFSIPAERVPLTAMSRERDLSP
jgi:hypothetical protein